MLFCLQRVRPTLFSPECFLWFILGSFFLAWTDTHIHQLSQAQQQMVCCLEKLKITTQVWRTFLRFFGFYGWMLNSLTFPPIPVQQNWGCESFGNKFVLIWDALREKFSVICLGALGFYRKGKGVNWDIAGVSDEETLAVWNFQGFGDQLC